MLRILCCLAIPLLGSCSLLGLRGQVERLEAKGSVVIHVTPPPRGPAPSYALAWTLEADGSRQSAGFQPLRGDGLAAFALALDRSYRVGAFTDENGNGKFDHGEPAAYRTDVEPFPLAGTGLRPSPIKMTLQRDLGLPPGTVWEIPRENQALGGKINVGVGDIASLDEPRFQPDAGSGGLWRPLEFLTGNAAGIYFLEPYDPRRTPVVLVYGIGGSPQDWRYFIDHFDRKTYQLWFYHYPSGMRLDRSAGSLAGGLRFLRQQHNFGNCYVVAHSMGGLVARTAITKAVAAEGANFIPKFVSISTPWGGHKAAESGIRHLKKPVPSWLDVVPDSDYLRQIYQTPLPAGTEHHMIYGSIEKGPLWLKGPNDGVVTVVSQTDPRVKQATTSFRHLYREHVEILNQPETVRLVEKMLR
jgi:hypothetical protein